MPGKATTAPNHGRGPWKIPDLSMLKASKTTEESMVELIVYTHIYIYTRVCIYMFLRTVLYLLDCLCIACTVSYTCWIVKSRRKLHPFNQTTQKRSSTTTSKLPASSGGRCASLNQKADLPSLIGTPLFSTRFVEKPQFFGSLQS